MPAPVNNLPLVLPRSGIETAKTVMLQPGQSLVARVVSTTSQPSLNIAGQLVTAKLPPGLEAGQKLNLEVKALSPNQVVLNLASEAKNEKSLAEALNPKERQEIAKQLVGAIIETKDPDLIGTALKLLSSAKLEQPNSAYPPRADTPAPQTQAPAQAQSLSLSHHPLQGAPYFHYRELRVQYKEESSSPSKDQQLQSKVHLVLYTQYLGPLEVSIWQEESGIRVQLKTEPKFKAMWEEASRVLYKRLGGETSLLEITARKPTEPKAIRPEGVRAYG